jgi:Asp-tRNA(Asn)/Glu-tRNA(Gln) amidotransferase C subunit
MGGYVFGIVSSVVGLFNVAGTIKDQILATKIIKFLSQISEISTEERTAMIDRLNEDDKFSGKLGATLIETLDRMESEVKPELSARCFAAYAKDAISYTELRHMLHSLERIPTFEISAIEEFSKADIKESMKMEESTLLAFVNAGLGQNNGGFDGGAIIPTKLCKLFVSSGVVKI